MDLFNIKRTAIPKLTQFNNRKSKHNSEEETDCSDLEYNYGDTDTHLHEMAELYSYSELNDYQTNVQEFEKAMKTLDLKPSWFNLSIEKKHLVVSRQLELLEVSDKAKRMNAARCILYLLQGCFVECQSDEEQQTNAKKNVLYLYEFGVYNIFVNLLNMEIESVQFHRKTQTNCVDSVNLRIILNVLYTFVEVLRISENESQIEFKNFRENLLLDIGLPHTEEHIIVKLLGMITRFCSGLASFYPMKKVLLLLWKLILVLLGGMDTLSNLKNEYRKKVNLPELQEDPIEIINKMRSLSPPASNQDILNSQKVRSSRQKRGLIKQSSLDESLVAMDLSYQNDENFRDFDDQQIEIDISGIKNIQETNDYRPQSATSMEIKTLPWLPKVRDKDLQIFLNQARIKFLGFKLDNDIETLVGLPEPIYESVYILKQYMYTSLADYQIKREEYFEKNPLIINENDVEQTPAEILYRAMLPNLPQHMIALLKILLAASPTSKAKNDSINIVSDILPVEVPISFSESIRLETDIHRQKEIIIKAISGILILLLKHFKANHIYQFEFISQHLVFANCIPLIIKFLNQNLVSYVSSKNTIPILDFPTCVIGDSPNLSCNDNIEIGEFPLCSWRNVYSCINLLRVLNKITKFKHSRIMMLVIFKSAPILKKSLKVRLAMMQVYILKLLKMQAKYLGRVWRKSNMKTLTMIYQTVRHRLNDDWAFGNDLEARPTDFQIEERFLRSAVDKFHARRYSRQYDNEFTPSDFSINSALGKSVNLSDEFKQHYIIWLNQEVFQNNIDWNALLTNDEV